MYGVQSIILDFSKPNQLITEANVSTTMPFWRDLFKGFKCLAAGWCSANDTRHDFFDSYSQSESESESESESVSELVSESVRLQTTDAVKRGINKKTSTRIVFFLLFYYFFFLIKNWKPNMRGAAVRCEKAFHFKRKQSRWVGIEINFMYHH